MVADSANTCFPPFLALLWRCLKAGYRVVWCCVLATCVGQAALSGSEAGPARPAAVEEFNPRRGWPRLATLAPGPARELRIAYLGGSITAAEGWRSLTTERLRQRFPRHQVVEIMAGLPGTGSDLGVCRLAYDVLRHRPDLLVVEFAVNDTNTAPDQVERAIEGIVRQTLHQEPATDLFFLYTVSTPGLPILEQGHLPPAAEAMEHVAEHYGIPSLHLGFDIARRIGSGTLIFKGTAQDGERAFSLDGVHPTPAGHRLYAENLGSRLPRLLEAPGEPRRDVPPPLRADNWERAGMMLFAEAAPHGEWTRVALDDPQLRGSTKSLLPPTWRAAQPGAALEFTFMGTRVGFMGIAAPDSGEFAVSVDGGEPVKGTFFDAYVSPTFCRQRPWFYPGTIKPGMHRVRIELLPTRLDKAGIKKAGGRPLEEIGPYEAHRLTVCSLLWIGNTSTR